MSVTHSHFQAAANSALSASDAGGMSASLDLLFLVISQSPDSEDAFAEYNSHVGVVGRIVAQAAELGLRSPELEERLTRLQAMVDTPVPSTADIERVVSVSLAPGHECPRALASILAGASHEPECLGTGSGSGSVTFKVTASDDASGTPFAVKVVDFIPAANPSVLLAMGATPETFAVVAGELLASSAAVASSNTSLVGPIETSFVEGTSQGSVSVVLTYPYAPSTLGAALAANPHSAPCSLESITTVLADVAAGLKALHEAGGVHGALHARNVMLSGSMANAPRASLREWAGDSGLFALIPALPSLTRSSTPTSDKAAMADLLRSVADAWFTRNPTAESKIVAIADSLVAPQSISLADLERTLVELAETVSVGLDTGISDSDDEDISATDSV